MKKPIKQTLVSIAVSMALGIPLASAHGNDESPKHSTIKHVLLISVDGLHQSDVDWFVQQHPTSTLATLVNDGIHYKNALTPFPSDSFPGLVGQITGGNPSSTGIYYDDGYSRELLPLSTSVTDCQNHAVAKGAEVQYAENIDKTTNGNILLDAGQGIPGVYPISNFTPGDLNTVPTAILAMKSSPADVRNLSIDASQLPVDPVTCTPVYPHQYLQVNTIFEVAHAKGLHTAWTDKHVAYEIANGPSGFGVDDLFAPEINSLTDNLDPSSPDFTKDNTNTQKYDSFKVLSIINEINGHDHAGNGNPGTPAIFGMNFQAVSTAQKLNTSTTPTNLDPTQLGGYTNDGAVPGPVIQSALSFVDTSLGQMHDAIVNNPSTKSNTAIILSAKHGQSPQNRKDLTIINDGMMLDALNAAWKAQNPTATSDLVAHAIDDDGVLLWLSDRSKAAADFAKQFLLSYTTANLVNGVTVPSGIGSDDNGNKIVKPFTHAGLDKVYAGKNAARFMRVKPSDARVPDVIGIAQQGTVFAGGKLSKIAEHGGFAKQDRNVPIMVWGAGIEQGKSVKEPVATTQIAPTILHLLGLNPKELKSVRVENTEVLPELD
jgi:predicted AlkP superfamily pyrophosphatase or phosphodiesterase